MKDSFSNANFLAKLFSVVETAIKTLNSSTSLDLLALAGGIVTIVHNYHDVEGTIPAPRFYVKSDGDLHEDFGCYFLNRLSATHKLNRLSGPKRVWLDSDCDAAAERAKPLIIAAIASARLFWRRFGGGADSHQWKAEEVDIRFRTRELSPEGRSSRGASTPPGEQLRYRRENDEASGFEQTF